MNERDWKRIFSQVGLACAGFVGFSILAQYLAAFICAYAGISLESVDAQLIVSSMAMYLVAFPIAGLLFKRISYPKPERIREKWSMGTWAVIFLICIGVMSVGNLVGRGFMLLFGSGSAQNTVDIVVENSGFWVSMVVMVAAGPIVEEILMRKLVIDRILIFGEKTAVLPSGLLFGLLHGNFYQFFYAFALGLIFGYVYVRTGRVRNTIVLHMMINFIGSVLIMGLMEWMSLPGIFGLIGTLMLLGYELLYLGASICGIVFLLVFWKKIRFYQTPYEWSAPFMNLGKRAGIVFGNIGMILFVILSIMEFAWNL